MTLYEKTVKGTLFGSGNPMHDIPQPDRPLPGGQAQARRADHQHLHARRGQPGLRRHARRQEHPGRDDPRALHAGSLLARVDERIVGLRREAEVLAATLGRGCHVVLEGPPGTGKSTLLRAVPSAAGFGVEFVEGNAELTPARLVGHHDPALVLEAGYRPDLRRRPAADGAARGPAALHRGAQPRPRGDAQRARRRAGRGRDPRAAARAHARRSRLPADRGHEPVRRGRHRAREPGDLRPHVPDRDRLPGRGGRAGDRRAGHRRRRARWSRPPSSSPG